MCQRSAPTDIAIVMPSPSLAACGGVATGYARQVGADHFLVVLEAAAGQYHRLAGPDVDRPVASLGSHAEDFLGDGVLDQGPRRRLVQNGDRALFDQALEQLPGIGIAVGGSVVEFVYTVRAGQIGEFDADWWVLMLLWVAAEAFEPCIVLAHLFGPHLHMDSGTV
jgi:hypothetical protein